MFKSKKTNVEYSELLETNPYLQSKALWNDLYGDVYERYKFGQLLNAGLVVSLLILIIGFVSTQHNARVKPLPFILHGNEILTADQTNFEELEHLKPKLAKHFAEEFIQNARSVSSDLMINTDHQIAAFSMTKGNAIVVLKDFYKKNDPQLICEKVIKSVHFNYILRKSKYTFNIHWHEDFRDPETGNLLKSQNYFAELSYQYQNPSSNEPQLRHNPLGFYVTELSWSPEISDKS